MNRLAFQDLISGTMGRSNILEIGPLNRPLVQGVGCHYFDLCSTEELKAKAFREGLDPSTVPVIDFYDEEGDLGVVNIQFSSVVSAHVVEHQPDLIRHLKQVSDLLITNGGKYWVIVPDHRYCFDHFLPISKLSDVVEAYEERRRTPNKYQVIEHRALTVHNNPRRHWAGDHGPIWVDLRGRWVSAEAEFEGVRGGHIDVHCWQFTPNVDAA